MNKLEGTDHDETKERDNSDVSNLFRKKIFALFPNIKTLIIATTNWHGSYIYTLSLLVLLELIQNSTSLQKVIVKAVENEYDDEDTWIKSLWSISSVKIKKCYASKNYAISLQNGLGRNNNEDWLIIEKK